MTGFEKAVIRDAGEQTHKLNSWENRFIFNLSQLRRDTILTEKQKNAIQRIHNKLDLGDKK